MASRAFSEWTDEAESKRLTLCEVPGSESSKPCASESI